MKRAWIAIAILVAACGRGTGQTSAPVVGTPRPLVYETNPPTAPTSAPRTTSAPIVTPAPTSEVTTAPPFTAIHLSGKGDKVAKFKIPEDQGGLAKITYSGSSNFAVWSIAADGSDNDLLVNTIGKYSGTVAFDMDDGEHSVAFKIEASGAWTVDIKPLTAARTWDGVSPLTGKGDDVVFVIGDISGVATAQIKYTGSSNFAVWSYATEGRDLLVNEIGKYSGEVLLPSGLLLLVFEAEGSWVVTPT